MWVFKTWTKSPRAQCSPNACEMLPVPCLGSAWISRSREGELFFPPASIPQIRGTRKAGPGRGSTPHGSAAPSGLGKPGVQKSHGERKEALGGKARVLGCAATAEDANQLSSHYSCVRDQGCPIPTSANMDVERTNPLCSIPCVTSSGRICSTCR